MLQIGNGRCGWNYAGETSVGKYPCEVVKIKNIIIGVEDSFDKRQEIFLVKLQNYYQIHLHECKIAIYKCIW